jgi:hypothetical protein
MISIKAPFLLTAILWANALSINTTTFITKGPTRDGTMMAEPIYTPIVELRPENSVAKQIKEGEALKCKVDVEEEPATVRKVPVALRHIILDCDGARFVLVGVDFGGGR